MTWRFTFYVALLTGCFGPWSALAQWTTQQIPLQAGWNAIYLEVQPEPADCDTVFAGLPVESVWAWNPRFSVVQFIQDPNALLPGQPNWLTYLPPNEAARAARSLFTVRGGQAYLVKLKPGAGPMTWSLTGRPVLRPTEWLADSFNLVGFHVATDGSPTFQTFFAGATAHTGKPMYRLNATGRWESISDPASAVLTRGRAYWVYSQGPSTYSGPFRIDTDQSDGLSFGRDLTEQTLRIRNTSASPVSVTVRPVQSQAPPNASVPVLAGIVPLALFRIDPAQSPLAWIPLTEAVQRTGIAPGEEWVVRLEVRRRDMANFVPPATHHGVLFQSLLEISNGAGVQRLVPVSAEGLVSHAPTTATRSPQDRSRSQVAPAAPAHPRAGLWVGNAVIAAVNQPSSIATPDRPIPTSAPFQFRLLLHVDQSGNVRLLQKVLEMFKEGTLKPDPADPSVKIVDQPGRYVLVTDDNLISQFTGATLRDGQRVARRLSSPAFAFPQPIAMSGTGVFGAGRFGCQIAMGYDDPLNPFKHRYHPDHDNLDDRFETKVPDGAESFAVLRQIDLEFKSEDPDHLSLSGWGDRHLGGVYRETVTGLHSKTLYAEGTFRLSQASRIGVLNDGR